MMNETPEFRIFYEYGYDSNSMFILRTSIKLNGVDSESFYQVLEPKWREIPKGEPLGEPTFRFSSSSDDRGSLQSLFNQLWNIGLRPKDGTGNSGHVESIRYHLEDMRKLVFKEKL